MFSVIRPRPILLSKPQNRKKSKGGGNNTHSRRPTYFALGGQFRSWLLTFYMDSFYCYFYISFDHIKASECLMAPRFSLFSTRRVTKTVEWMDGEVVSRHLFLVSLSLSFWFICKSKSDRIIVNFKLKNTNMEVDAVSGSSIVRWRHCSLVWRVVGCSFGAT